MAEQDLLKVARSVVEAFNKEDWASIQAAFTPNSVYYEYGTQRQIRGPGEFIAAMQGWKEAMPDSRGKVTNAFATGDRAVLELTWEGTQTGPFKGPSGTLPPNRKRQVTSAAWIFEFDGGKIKESHQYFDMLSFLQQIGALRQLEAAARR